MDSHPQQLTKQIPDIFKDNEKARNPRLDLFGNLAMTLGVQPESTPGPDLNDPLGFPTCTLRSAIFRYADEHLQAMSPGLGNKEDAWTWIQWQARGDAKL